MAYLSSLNSVLVKRTIAQTQCQLGGGRAKPRTCRHTLVLLQAVRVVIPRRVWDLLNTHHLVTKPWCFLLSLNETLYFATSSFLAFRAPGEAPFGAPRRPAPAQLPLTLVYLPPAPRSKMQVSSSVTVTREKQIFSLWSDCILSFPFASYMFNLK